MIKIMMGITIGHALIVTVPTYFSYYFGDDVSETEKRLGASNQSELGLKMSRYK